MNLSIPASERVKRKVYDFKNADLAKLERVLLDIQWKDVSYSMAQVMIGNVPLHHPTRQHKQSVAPLLTEPGVQGCHATPKICVWGPELPATKI